MPLLQGKLGIVFVSPTNDPLAWAIAQAWARERRETRVHVSGRRVKETVAELAGAFGADTLILPCDVTKDEEIAGVFKNRRRKIWPAAFAPALGGVRAKTALEGILEHQPGRVSHCPRRERLFTRRTLARRRAAHARRRQHHRHELLRRGKGRAALQCHGRGQGRARSQHTLSRLRSRPRKKSASIASAPARSTRWPRAASAVSMK